MKMLSIEEDLFKKYSIFYNKTIHLDWRNILLSSEVEHGYSIFHDMFTTVFDSCLEKNIYKYIKHEWITKSLEKSIKKKNKLFYLSNIDPTDENTAIYKK